MTCVRFGVAFVCTWLAPLAAATEAAVEFNRDIRPIFSDKCYTCHGPDAGNRKTKLRFDVEGGAKIDLGKGRQAIAPAIRRKARSIVGWLPTMPRFACRRPTWAVKS